MQFSTFNIKYKLKTFFFFLICTRILDKSVYRYEEKFKEKKSPIRNTIQCGHLFGYSLTNIILKCVQYKYNNFIRNTT